MKKKKKLGFLNHNHGLPPWLMKGRGGAWYKKKRAQRRYDGLQKPFPRFQSGGQRFPTIAGRLWKRKRKNRTQ